MTTHTLNGREVMLVEVPEQLTNKLSIEGNMLLQGDVMGFPAALFLPEGFTYSILLDTKEAGEEDYIPLVERMLIAEVLLYRDYRVKEYEAYVISKPSDSFKTKVRSNGYDPSKRYVLISQNKK
jgi:hypothetical protein